MGNGFSTAAQNQRIPLILCSSGKTVSHRRAWRFTGVLHRKRWIDDVIKMAALRARILAGLRF